MGRPTTALRLRCTTRAARRPRVRRDALVKAHSAVLHLHPYHHRDALTSANVMRTIRINKVYLLN